MVHIVFQEADVNILKEAIELDSSLAGDIVEIKDDFSVGPIKNIYEPQGYGVRREWWSLLLAFSPYADSQNIVDDKTTVNNLIQALNKDKSLQVWIWLGQNQHDVCGYYWMICQLKDYQGKVFLLYLNNLPFINEKGGLFYPTALHQIQPKEFIKAKKLARLVTVSEFEADTDEWKRLCDQNALVRVLEAGKKIVNKEANYYDDFILSVVTPEQQRLQKILHTLYTKTNLHVSDLFVVWRIRELITDGKLETEGDWSRGWKEVTIKFSGLTVAQKMSG